MIPPGRNDAAKERSSKAFDLMTGAKPAAAQPADGQAEQAEDELLEQLSQALEQANQVMAKIKGVQQQEAEGEQHEEQQTGSPSAQGMP